MSWWRENVEKPFNKHVVDPIVGGTKDVGGAISRGWKDAGGGISNWWKSLPPGVRLAIVVIAVAIAMYFTAGAFGLVFKVGFIYGSVGVSFTVGAGGIGVAAGVGAGAAFAASQSDADVSMTTTAEDEVVQIESYGDNEEDGGVYGGGSSEDKPSSKKGPTSPPPQSKSEHDQKQIETPNSADSRQTAARGSAPEDDNSDVIDPHDIDLDVDDADVDAGIIDVGSSTLPTDTSGTTLAATATDQLDLPTSKTGEPVTSEQAGAEIPAIEQPTQEVSTIEGGPNYDTESSEPGGFEDRWEKTAGEVHIGMSITPEDSYRSSDFWVGFDPEDKTVIYQGSGSEKPSGHGSRTGDRAEKSRNETVDRRISDTAANVGREADVTHAVTESLTTPKQKYRHELEYSKHGKVKASKTSLASKTRVGSKLTRATGIASIAGDFAGLYSSSDEYGARASALGEDDPYTREAKREGQIVSTSTAIGAAVSLVNPVVGVAAKVFVQETMEAKEERIRRDPEYREYLHRYNRWLEYRSTLQPITLPNDGSCSIYGNTVDAPTLNELVEAARYSDQPTIRQGPKVSKPVFPYHLWR